MADFIRAAITFLLSNFPLTFFVIGLIASLIAIAHLPAPRDAATIVEKLISWHVFFALAFTAAFRGFDLRLAAILGSSVFLFGAAAGHAYQMVTERNFAPGNAGIIFCMDIIVPLVGFVLLALQHRYGRLFPRLS
jgi:hypothetical protein